ncbi:DUF4097 family beta strand repeat-containing protein [Bacillus salitolerans]|uniref:DUF4097 family beta strand repeat-containing protein n=1 Tax=Bacillus salitolerans TaxID=1437434 RepID=A0ABW4LSD9_9BACI
MRHWKVGTLTAGLLLIFLGIIWLINNFWAMPIGWLISNGWPILLVILGLEVLLHQFIKKEEPLKFDGISLFIVIMLGFVSMMIYGFQSSGIFPAISSVVNGQIYTEEFELSADTNSIEEIIIDIPNADVSIIGDQGNSFLIDGVLNITTESEKQANNYFNNSIKINTVGNKLIFQIEHPQNQKIFGWQKFEGNFYITVPEDKFVNVKVINGEIEAENLLMGSKIEMVNGNLSVKKMAQSTILENTNGNVEVENWDGKLIATSTNGNIEVKTINPVSNTAELKTVNGSISMQLPVDSDSTIKAETNNGTVKDTVNWIRKNEKEDFDYKKEGTLILGKGTFNVQLSSVNGDVKVDVK